MKIKNKPIKNISLCPHCNGFNLPEEENKLCDACDEWVAPCEWVKSEPTENIRGFDVHHNGKEYVTAYTFGWDDDISGSVLTKSESIEAIKSQINHIFLNA